MKSAMSISKPTSALFGMLLVCAAAYAQSGSDLRSKYGPPSEAYEVRPNVLMTVVFGADGQACEMVIETRHTSKAGVNGNNLIPLPIAEEILNEVVPKEKRGKGGRAITFSGGCSSVTSEEYENVSIYRSEQCLPGGGKAVLAITVKWKHRQCQSKGVGKEKRPPEPMQRPSSYLAPLSGNLRNLPSTGGPPCESGGRIPNEQSPAVR